MMVSFMMFGFLLNGFFRIVVVGFFLVWFKNFFMLVWCKSFEFVLLVCIIKKWGIKGFMGVNWMGLVLKSIFFLFLILFGFEFVFLVIGLVCVFLIVICLFDMILKWVFFVFVSL